MAAPFLLPLGIGPALLLANLTLQFQPPILQIPQISIQTSNSVFPLQFHQNEQQISLQNGPVKGSLLDNGRELRLHVDCLDKQTRPIVRRQQRICQSLGELGQTAALSISFDGPHRIQCLQNVKLNGRLLHAFWCLPFQNFNRPRRIRNVRLFDKNAGEEEEFGRRRRLAKVASRKFGSRKWSWGDEAMEESRENLNVEKEGNNEGNVEDAPPQLMFGPMGPTIHVKPGTRVQLGQSHLRVFDPDTGPDRVWLHLEEISPSLDLVDRMGMRLRRFSLAQFNAGEVQLLALEEEEIGGSAELGMDGHATLIARDKKGGQSAPLTLRVTFTPLKVILDRNAGIRLAHHSSVLIESGQLHSKCANPQNNVEMPSLSARYSIVDQPEFGIVECLRRENPSPADIGQRWTICSEFFQSDIDALSVRYKHTSANRSRADDFDFQVHCADNSSPVQILQIDFINLSIRVFVQEALSLNQTDQAVLGRRNMLATVFPQNFQPDQLVYHMVEAPKLGMLLRLVPETGKQRRVGISSNFTQQQIDQGLLSYKLHFAPFSVLNDFFTFRMLTPAGPSDELFRFDIVYLPGGGLGEIRLRNSTLVVPEGGIQQISNATLWLEAADGTREFRFRVGLPPLNGRLLLEEKGGRRALDFDGIFHSKDILEHRLFYEHSGDESDWDRIFFLAESEMRDPGGGKGHTPLPFFFSISILNGNNRSPQLLPTIFGAKNAEQNNNIYLLENGERTLWLSLLPLIDLDQLDWPSRPAEAKHFSVAKLRHPFSVHVLPEPANSRDFVICARDALEMPLREFGEDQLKGGQLVLRHLGGARNVTLLRLTVNDGRHNIPVPVWMFAAPQPFLRLATSAQLKLPFPAIEGKMTHFLLSIAHLWAQTNVDVPDSAIHFEFESILAPSPFRLLLSNGTFIGVKQFSQQDIFQNRLFYCLGEGEQIGSGNKFAFVKLHFDPELDIPNRPKAEELILNITFVNQTSASESSLPIGISIRNGGLSVQKGGSGPIDANLFGIANENVEEDIYAKFFVVKVPKSGEIIFQRHRHKESAPSANYHIPLLTFDKSILHSGQLQYLHNNDLAANADNLEDEFQLKIVVQSKRKKDYHIQIGPFAIPIHIEQSNQLQLMPNQQPIIIAPGFQLTLDEHFFQSSSSANSFDLSPMEYRILNISSPSLSLKSRRNGLSLVNSFGHSQFVTGDIVLGAKAGSRNQRAKIRIEACDNYRYPIKCGRPVEIQIQIRGKGKENDGLKLKNNTHFRKKIEAGDDIRMVLELEDSSNLSANAVNFMVWQQRGGFLHKESNMEAIYKFTQEDISKGRIYFKVENPRKAKTLGFYLIYADDVQQFGPEFYQIKQEMPNVVQSGIKSPIKLKGNGQIQTTPAPAIPNAFRKGVFNSTENNHPSKLEPSTLQLRNFTEITYKQGKTYILLNRSHLGAESTDPSQISYNITKGPENGTFYWVDGEKEANIFTQSNIDNGEVLYAQLNMNAFEDSFEFILSNDEIELLPKRGTIRVLPVFQPQKFLTNSRQITQLSLAHLNATELEGTSPRYLVVKAPEYARFFIYPHTNESTIFFTHSDIVDGKLFFHAFDVPKRIKEDVHLELRSDSVQPARIVWPIEIRPNELAAAAKDEASEDGGIYTAGMGDLSGLDDGTKQQGGQDKIIIPPPPPDMNYHFPIAILIAVVLLVVGILLCRKKPSDETSITDDENDHKKSNGSDRTLALKSSLKKKSDEGGGRHKMGISSNERTGMDTKNLLDATVYASINYRQPKDNLFANNEKVATFDGGGEPAMCDPLSATGITSLVDMPFNAGSLHARRRESARTAIPFSRSESKERQQLLASAISAALASKNLLAKNDSTTEESQTHQDEKLIEGKGGGKNEFWV